MRSKPISGIVITLSLVILCQSAQAQDLSVVLRLASPADAAAPGAPSMSSGPPIIIVAVAKNTTQDEVTVPDGEDWYRPKLSRDGVVVPYIPEVQKRVNDNDRRGRYTATGLAVLKAGEVRETQLDIEYWYGRLRAGHYVLAIERRFFKHSETSDTLEFDVTE